RRACRRWLSLAGPCRGSAGEGVLVGSRRVSAISRIMSTLRIQAGYLPGLSSEDVQWQVLPFEQGDQRVEVSVPVLSPAQMGALAERVRRASVQHLKTLAVSEIISIIDRAIARLLDRDDPYRQQADTLLPIVSGYDAE